MAASSRFLCFCLSLNDCFNLPFPSFFSLPFIFLVLSDFTSEKFRESREIFLSSFICLQSEQERACVEAISSSSLFRFTSVYATSPSPCLSLCSLPCMYPSVLKCLTSHHFLTGSSRTASCESLVFQKLQPAALFKNVHILKLFFILLSLQECPRCSISAVIE